MFPGEMESLSYNAANTHSYSPKTQQIAPPKQAHRNWKMDKKDREMRMKSVGQLHLLILFG